MNSFTGGSLFFAPYTGGCPYEVDTLLLQTPKIVTQKEKTMTTKPLPTVGAAMPISALETYREWLIAGQRDLEIQDPFAPEVLDGNWQPLLQQARTLLDGFTGRLGIHGPFMSLTLLARDPKIRTVVTDRLRQGVEFAQALGGTHMVVHSPFDYCGSPFLPHSPGHGQAQQFEIIHATLDPVVALAYDRRAALDNLSVYRDKDQWSLWRRSAYCRLSNTPERKRKWGDVSFLM